MERGERREAFEFKLSRAPRVSRGLHELASDLKPDRTWVVAPVAEPYEYRPGLQVSNLSSVLKAIA
jgi:hypothetical protein